MRGSGKTTLAIITSTAMKRKIVDTEMAFHDATGLSTTAFKKTHGNQEFQRRQYGLLRDILAKYPKDCIIVSSWIEYTIRNLLVDFAASHPVIHIARDRRAIQEYLRVTDEIKIRELLNYSETTFRTCSNFEFFNISEELPKPGDSSVVDYMTVGSNSEQKAPAPYLTLKRAERHFLKFLSLIMPKDTIPFIESAFPLAAIPTERRMFTYAMSVPLSMFLSDGLEIEDLETGADAVELVVDHVLTQDIRLSADGASMISRTMGHIRRNVVIPILYHVPWPQDAASSTSQRSLYFDYLQHGLRLAPEYITVDLRLDDHLFSRVVECKGTCKVMAMVNLTTDPPPSWFNPVWTSYYRKAQGLGCDMVRFLRPATADETAFDVQGLRRLLQGLGPPILPMVAYNTGAKGRTSQCFNPTLTSVIPESLAEHMVAKTTTYMPPAMTARQATEALHASFVYDAMKLYVFGARVDYSMSPAMHNKALKALGIPHIYRPHSTDSLGSIRHLMEDTLFAGASIGLPFKVEVISLTHSLSRHAKAIGAVNTLIPMRNMQADGSIPDLFFSLRNRAGPVLALYGENTDWIGIRACIRRGLSPANAVRPSTSGLVIGAGGMARAAVYAMLQLGVKNIAIFNRTTANADKMVAHFSHLLSHDDLPLLSPSSDTATKFHVLRSRDEAWPSSSFRPPTMIVSCIPTHSIGEQPAPQFTLPDGWMQNPTGGVVVELAYKYLNTPLLEQVRAQAHRGWVVMDGLDLLPEQGFAQFELFTGRRAPRRLMRGEVFRSYPDDHGESNQSQLQPRLENILEQEP